MRFYKLKTLALLPLLILTSFSINASTLEIGTIGLPPYGIHEQKTTSGLYYDLANLVTLGAGYQAKNKTSPYARIIKEIKFGAIDLTIMFRNPALDNYVDYVAPLPSLKTVVIGLENKKFKNIASLRGKKIAYLRGSSFSDEINNNNNIIKYPINNYVQGIRMLMVGRADAIIGPLAAIMRSSRQFRDKGLLLGEPLVVDHRTPWIQVSKNSNKDIDIKKLKESFLQVQRGDILNELRAKYIDYPRLTN